MFTADPLSLVKLPCHCQIVLFRKVALYTKTHFAENVINRFLKDGLFNRIYGDFPSRSMRNT